jgi:ribosome modulation factor
MNEAAEIKRAISQAKHDAKEERAVQRAFEDGQTAQLVGETLESCRLKIPARRNAWERGWLDAERKRAEHESIKAMSEAEKAEARQKLSAIKSMIGG